MAKQGNQVGEISIGVTATTDTLKSKLREAEQSVSDSARRMGDEQVKASNRAGAAMGGVGEKVEGVRKKFMGLRAATLGWITAIVSIPAIIEHIVGEVKKAADWFTLLTESGQKFAKETRFQEASRNIDRFQQSMQELTIEAEQIDNRFDKMRVSVTDAAREMEKSIQEMGAGNEARADQERKRVARITEQALADIDKLEERAWQERHAAELKANMDMLADLAKARDESQREYNQAIKDNMDMLAEMAEEQRRVAEDFAKAYEESAKRIEDALTNAFNASAASSQQLTRQVSSDISQIIPLLQRLIAIQKR